MESEKWCTSQCTCHQYPAKFKDEPGHVDTTDLSLIKNEKLQGDMQKGTKYGAEYAHMGHDNRGGPVDNAADAMKLLIWSIGQYIKTSSEINEIPEHRFSARQDKLMKKVQEKLSTLPTNDVTNTGQPSGESGQSDQVGRQRVVQQLPDEFAIMTADKAATAYVIHCKT